MCETSLTSLKRSSLCKTKQSRLYLSTSLSEKVYALKLKKLRDSMKPVLSSPRFLNQMHHDFRCWDFSLSIRSRAWKYQMLLEEFVSFKIIPTSEQSVTVILCKRFFSHIPLFAWEEWILINKTDFNLQPIIISKSRLNKFFNLSELPSEIGGLQSYNHDEWIRNRVVSNWRLH